ncbi:hypothetical protein UFOVP2_39 [uncultured Caudovirales phage]|uniref:Uncharacterized protein n=1 Tax=uncultured Caudovirales phage TaxID=2100421 RepID=A0A6J5KKD7_9CAUD|nr:hypothetical protein UFOVP2_39 [uncultured Caudovirales phage]
MPDNPISARDFGHLEAEVAALTELMKAQTVAMSSMSIRLDAMNTTLTEARGGWKVLMLVGGAGALAGNIIPWAIGHIKW